MKRAAGKSRCPINLGLEVVGDPWSLLVVRDIVYFGKRRFGEFLASEEGIAPSVLTDRLNHLVACGVLERSKDPHDARRTSYTLTEHGLGLIPVLLSVAQWTAQSDLETTAPAEWINAVASNPAAMVERIVQTIRRGGSIFVGPDSVAAQLAQG